MKREAPGRRLPLILVFLFLFSLLPLAAPGGTAWAEGISAVYFPNWNVYASSLAQVKNLPWDRLDCVLHAFWKIVPEGDGFAVVSTDPWADTDPGNPSAHFPQYEECAKRYPRVQILLSIGGWTCSDQFSAMAGTAPGRSSFIQSCLDILERYPFFSGLDLDWEYPGVARKGNPASEQDGVHYTLLLKELRAALDERFGKGKKQLTVCAAGSARILKKQDYAALFPYVTRIHLMTYDLADMAAGKTAHHSPLLGEYSADAAVKYLLKQGVPAAKIAIGTPLYGHGWKDVRLSDGALNAAGTGISGTLLWNSLKTLESAAVPPGVPGWHAGYDEESQAAYLWNDDPASASYRCFYSYESARSLDAKLKYIRVHGLGGLIVWQSGGDDAAAGWPMLSRIHRALHP